MLFESLSLHCVCFACFSWQSQPELPQHLIVSLCLLSLHVLPVCTSQSHMSPAPLHLSLLVTIEALGMATVFNLKAPFIGTGIWIFMRSNGSE